MSCDWGYACTQCDDATDTWLNHGEDRLRQLYAAAPMLIALMEQEGYGDAFELHSMWASAGLPIEGAVQWLRQHQGHAVCLHNEYGAFEPLHPTETQRQFSMLFTVSGAERRAVQQVHGLRELPDSATLRRLYAKELQDGLARLLDPRQWEPTSE